MRDKVTSIAEAIATRSERRHRLYVGIRGDRRTGCPAHGVHYIQLAASDMNKLPLAAWSRAIKSGTIY
jgi:hypothetical protein